MKILITSDNHLGYKETDSILFDDSYVTFNEVLSIALEEKVDLILQGGDLFHDNRPSRSCLKKVIGLLRTYCIGDTKSELRSNSLLNSDDRNINISIPIIAIHGNHDDPGGLRMTSPIDILQSGGFVNYIGKVDRVDKIDVYPLLLEKDYRVAIYGLGHIKDRRLYRAFSEGAVTFHKPQNYSSWYNILLIHQNRVSREKECLPEDFIDDFFDLVIYGHEHESMVLKGKTLVLQPGSTVRTSLCEKESLDKYVYILNIGELSSLDHVKLKTVRPFLLKNMRVEDSDNAEEQIRKKAEGMVEEIKKNNLAPSEEMNRTIIDLDAGRFRCKMGSRQIADTKTISKKLNYKVKELLPLIRLRVETSRNIVLNRHKFNIQFRDLVANPSEALRFSRKAQRSYGIKVYPKVDKIEISQILRNILRDVKFGVLNGNMFFERLNDFVFKGDKHVFVEMVRKNVKEIVDKIDYSLLLGGDLEKTIRNTVGDGYDISDGENKNEASAEIESVKINPGSNNYEESRGVDSKPQPGFRTPETLNFSYAKKSLEVENFKADESNDCILQEQNKQKQVYLVEEGVGKKMKREDDSSADVSFSFSRYL